MAHHILIPLDGSSLAENVLPHAVALTRGSEAQASVVRVLELGSAGTLSRPPDPFDWQLRKAEAEAYLQTISSRLHEAGLPSTVKLLEGKAAECVIRYAKEENADLILLSSHGQSGMSGWNVSSIVQKIIFRAHTSFILIRAYQPVENGLTELNYSRILIPLDGSQRAENVLPAATSLAKEHDALLIIAHVVRQPEIPRRTLPSQEDTELADKLTERNRAESDRYLSELTSRFDVKNETRLVVSQNPSTTLHELVENEQIDLVIMNAHGYTGGSQWPFGSIATNFITYGTTPLMVIQDIPRDLIEPTRAEIMSRERGGR
ncbi:MAG: universal stress protein [Omnitrophica WOR_2 bacterium]